MVFCTARDAIHLWSASVHFAAARPSAEQTYSHPVCAVILANCDGILHGKRRRCDSVVLYSVYIRGQCVSGERWGFPGVYSALALNCISHISCQVSRQFRRSADHTGGLHLLTIWLYTSQSAIHHGYGHLWAPVACWWCSSALIPLTSTMWLRDRSSGCLNTQPSLFSLSLRPASVLSSGCDAGVF